MKTEKWTKEEEQIIKNFYTENGTIFCFNLLKGKRTLFAIRRRAKVLNISKPKNMPCKNIYSKAILEPVILSSNSIREVLEKVGLRTAGGNYAVIKKYINLYKIDTTHFETYKIERYKNLKKINQKKELKEVLVVNSSYSRAQLKKRLYDEGLKEKKCEMCGQGEFWNGKKMSLILDHKNGVYNDNRLENLRIVCSNCNATLDTHCGKHNRKRNVKIKELGLKESVDFRSVLTKEKEMSYIKRRKVERPTFENLKEDVDKNGYCSVGRKYNVTDNTIRKWLKFYEKNNTTSGSALA